MSERQDATDLLDAVADYSPPPSDDRTFKIGTVIVAGTGVCTILFDGETITGGKQYPCLGSYAPVAGDRVVVAPVGSQTSWLVLGAIRAYTPVSDGNIVLEAEAGTFVLTGTVASGFNARVAKLSSHVIASFYVTIGGSGAAVNNKVFQVSPSYFRPSTSVEPQGRPGVGKILNGSGTPVGEWSFEVYSDGFCYVKSVSTTVSSGFQLVGSIGYDTASTSAAGSGPILHSPNGAAWRLGVTNAGAATFTAL